MIWSGTGGGSGGISTTLTSAHILVGNAGNTATDVAVSGDITITNGGVVAIATGVIVDADVNGSAAIAASKCAPPGATTQLVYNDGGAYAGDADLLWAKATDTLTVGSNANDKVETTSAATSSTVRRLNVICGAAGANFGTGGPMALNIAATTSGTFSDSTEVYGANIRLLAGGTVTNGAWSIALRGGNVTAITGTTLDGAGDQTTDGYAVGVEGDSSGTGTINIGVMAKSRNSTSVAIGLLARADFGDNGRNYGVMGYSVGTATTANVGGYFALKDLNAEASQLPPAINVALAASNGATAYNIINGYDSTTLVFSVADGGLCTVKALQLTAATTQNLTADNTEIDTTNKTYIVLTSDDGTATNRTFTLENGVAGQILVIEWGDTDAGEIAAGTNLKLAGGATWTPTQYDTLTVIWSAVASAWLEISRSANA